MINEIDKTSILNNKQLISKKIISYDKTKLTLNLKVASSNIFK